MFLVFVVKGMTIGMAVTEIYKRGSSEIFMFLGGVYVIGCTGQSLFTFRRKPFGHKHDWWVCRDVIIFMKSYV